MGLAIKKNRLAREVIGFFRDKKKIAAAVKIGAIDRGTTDFKGAVGESDLVILCSPVNDIIEKLKLIKKWGYKNTLVTDTGSTKTEIIQAARGLDFIGSHPLAGSEQSGIVYAKSGLFSGSLCILTPTGREKASSVRRIEGLWRGLGADTAALTPDEHDHILAFTSHLPHVAAFSLIKAIPERYMRFSAGGLKDTTRIALSNPDIWAGIFTTNKKDILLAVTELERCVREFKKTIATNDKRGLLLFLKSAQGKRKKLVP